MNKLNINILKDKETIVISTKESLEVIEPFYIIEEIIEMLKSTGTKDDNTENVNKEPII
mgnify:CR=1 FL=1